MMMMCVFIPCSQSIYHHDECCYLWSEKKKKKKKEQQVCMHFVVVVADNVLFARAPMMMMVVHCPGLWSRKGVPLHLDEDGLFSVCAEKEETIHICVRR